MSQKVLKPIVKMTYTLDSPYPSITWPSVSPQDQATILDQLCCLLSPIGEYRSKFVKTSKGKRDKKKRKLEDQKNLEIMNVSLHPRNISELHGIIPPVPLISSFVTIGFNSTERALEAASRTSLSANTSGGYADKTTSILSKPLVAVLVDRSDQPPILYSHLPLLISAVSYRLEPGLAVRLVALPNGSSTRLSKALHVPRASIIGIRVDAPGSNALMKLVKERIGPVETSWFRSGHIERYLPVEIKVTKRNLLKQLGKSSITTRKPQRSIEENII